MSRCIFETYRISYIKVKNLLTWRNLPQKIHTTFTNNKILHIFVNFDKTYETTFCTSLIEIKQKMTNFYQWQKWHGFSEDVHDKMDLRLESILPI